MEELFSKIKEAFMEYEDEELLDCVRQALEAGADPLEIISLLSKSLEEIGAAFAAGELFLPDMVMAGDQMEECMEILTPAMSARSEDVPKLAKVVLGTVAGDIHDIGKNMVKTMLTVSGFEVIDLGTDVSAAQFYASAVSEEPAVVTGVKSRFIVGFAGVIIAVLGFIPKLAQLLALIPMPVIGGASLVPFGIITTSGIQILMREKLADRDMLIVAVALAVGIGFNFTPAALADYPYFVSALLNGIPGTAITATVLNLLLPGRRSSEAATEEQAEAEI